MAGGKPRERFTEHLRAQLDGIRAGGLFKGERILTSPQQPEATVRGGKGVLNLCANNYLGLANHPRIRQAAKDAIDRWGYGMASVRFICGTVEIHKDLEKALANFLGKADTILYSSCWDANGGLFETILGPEDAVISDELNHASIIDGIRLCKARRLRYKNNDMADLEARLKEAADCRFRLIATDGVFSMDGTIANLPAICELADRYDAMIMVDDSHATGFVGPTGRGTHEFHGCIDRIDILTGTLGKALGGGSGGYTCGPEDLVQMLRQRSRPYLFSNSLPPPIVAASLESLKLLTESTELRDRLEANTAWFRREMTAAGFNIIPGVHPITPVMLGDAVLAANMAEKLLAKGLYVIGFSYPVVPMGKARIRTQVCAAHTPEELAFALNAFREAKAELGV
ncbi:MAG: glycine C-acetyltransferase [Gemmataceae bacterium]